MDLQSIGKDRASEVLAILLRNTDSKTKHRTLSIYNDYMMGVKDICNVKASNIRYRLSLLWLDDFKSKARLLSDHQISSHLITVMTTRRRDIILRVLS